MGNTPLKYVDPSGHSAIPAILVYALLTALETVPDVVLDYAISKYTDEEFYLVKSSAENYAFNLVPGAGEAKTIKQVNKLYDGIKNFNTEAFGGYS